MITQITKTNISEELKINKIYYSGRMTEPDFLSRNFDLSKLQSSDYRYKTAYEDIYQHTVNNSDYEVGWVFNDSRFNLMNIDDKKYLSFLCDTIHPSVRSGKEEVQKILGIYNKHLKADNYEIYASGEISGYDTFSFRLIDFQKISLDKEKGEIIKYLDYDYVKDKISLMESAIESNTGLAIGTAKELIETTAKSILKSKGIQIGSSWDLTKLISKTNEVIDIIDKNIGEHKEAEKSLKKVIGGLSASIQGLAELRNNYGSGHGKEATFKELEKRHAKLLVGIVSDIVIFYLDTCGKIEL